MNFGEYIIIDEDYFKSLKKEFGAKKLKKKADDHNKTQEMTQKIHQIYLTVLKGAEERANLGYYNYNTKIENINAIITMDICDKLNEIGYDVDAPSRAVILSKESDVIWILLEWNNAD